VPRETNGTTVAVAMPTRTAPRATAFQFFTW
jgi:hypothetical protein